MSFLMRHLFVVLVFLGLFCGSSMATEEPSQKRKLKLQSYEPNLIGYTKDNNDVAFMDFTLSLKYPMFHDGETLQSPLPSWLPLPYFAFTGRLGQYIGTRDSSPVIGKRFNPKLFFRFLNKDRSGYFDIGYSHESNGQSINSKESFENLQNDFMEDGESESFARDYISRGWDYIDIAFKKEKQKGNRKHSGYLRLKGFLNRGLLQDEIEEFEDWEGEGGGKRRKEVDGITFLYKLSTKYKQDSVRSERLKFFSGSKIAGRYTTGYKNPFRHSTIKLEGTLILWDIPIMLWWSRGYNSDLVDYYKRVNSFGIAVEMKNFLDDI